MKKAKFFIEKEHFTNKLLYVNNIDLKSNELADLIYIDESNFVTPTIKRAFEQLKENGVLIIEKPYKNIEHWKQVRTNPNSQVIVDTYYFGFIFNNKRQAKEEFFIRL